jgi:hypothetical protein
MPVYYNTWIWPCEAETCRRLIEYKKWMCYTDGQKNKYSLLNECNRMLKYNISMPKWDSNPRSQWTLSGREIGSRSDLWPWPLTAERAVRHQEKRYSGHSRDLAVASPNTLCSTPERKAALTVVTPIAVAARSKVRTVFARSNTEIVGSNPT